MSNFYGEFLCDAFESDMQSVEACRAHINSVVAVITSKERVAEWAGNAYVIYVTSENTVFSNELTGDKGGEIPTYEYLSALLLWKAFLTNPSSPVEGEIASTKEEAIRLASADF